MRTPILTIDGVHPAEYAQRWGDGSTADGVLFYNCSDSAHGRTIARASWGRAQWVEFAAAVVRVRDRVRLVIAAPCGPARNGWTRQDAQHLGQLFRWAQARDQGPQCFTYYDGESGRPIVRMPERVVYECSGPGTADAAVAEALAGKLGPVEWLADEATIRKCLRQWGAWDDEELADAQENRTRMLWLAARDIAENPESYAD